MAPFKVSRYRVPLSFAVAIVILILASPTAVSVLAGLPLVLSGEFLRTWSSGFIKKNRELATGGPYAYTRNPLYLGNFLIGLGFAIMVRRPLLLLVFAVLFFLVYRALIFEEEDNLERRFGETFIEYKRDVPRFFPRIKRPVNTGRFDWGLVMKHHEYYAWLGHVTGIVWLLWKI
jgi:protein-S-isoprenylcysteine O-methyltransferase Ste14